MFTLFIKAMIALSVVILLCETLPNQGGYTTHFMYGQLFITVVFAVEYYVRKTWRTFLKPMSVVDLLAIVSFFTLFLPAQLDILQLLRWSIVFKLTRYTLVDDHIVQAFKLVKKELVAFSFFILIVLLISSSAIYYAEHAAQPDKFISIPHSLWWSIVTLTTVGYGDLTPITPAGKIVAGVVMLSGVAVIAIPTAFWTYAIMEVVKQNKETL